MPEENIKHSLDLTIMTNIHESRAKKEKKRKNHLDCLVQNKTGTIKRPGVTRSVPLSR